MIPNRTNPNMYEDVKKFIALAQPELVVELGEQPKLKALELGRKLIDEEVNKELFTTLTNMILAGGGSLEQLAQLLDDIVDSIYVLTWLAAVCSLPLNAAWNEIQRANMSKFPLHKNHTKTDIKPEGAITRISGEHYIFRDPETGKVMKPTNFIPPNIFEVLIGTIQIHKIRTMPNVIATPFMQEYFHKIEERREKGEIQL